MDTVVAALAEEHAYLDLLLSRLDPDDWDRPSRCEGWTVADVVLHLAQTDELAIASAQGRFRAAIERMSGDLAPTGSVDDGAAAWVAHERGQPGPVVGDRWRTRATELREVLGACDPHQRVQWVAGEVSTRTLATTRLAEAWIHTGDVADAFEIVPQATDRLWHIVHLAWRTLPYALAQAGKTLTGPVAFELQAPSGATWSFTPDADPVTVVRGQAAQLCQVASRRVAADRTELVAEGPDAEAVLDLVRTYA